MLKLSFILKDEQSHRLMKKVNIIPNLGHKQAYSLLKPHDSKENSGAAKTPINHYFSIKNAGQNASNLGISSWNRSWQMKNLLS